MRSALMAVALAACGLAASEARAVVGGRDDASAGRMAVMVLNARGGVCTGIVLSRRAVLTAAHCVAGAELRVHWKDASGEPVLVLPAAVARHAGYDADAIGARRRSIDMALLRLDDPLPQRFEPASLSAAQPRAGKGIALGGYGVLREGEARSTGTFRTAALSVVEPYGPGRVLLWASDPAGAGKSGSGACQGDSGGPMSSNGAVVAVTSWSTGAGKSRCGLLSQGVLLGPQRNWIDQVLAGWGERAIWTQGE